MTCHTMLSFGLQVLTVIIRTPTVIFFFFEIDNAVALMYDSIVIIKIPVMTVDQPAALIPLRYMLSCESKWQQQKLI